MATSLQIRRLAPLHQLPQDVSGVFRAAARLLAHHRLHQGDLVPDAFDRCTTDPHAFRPMSIVAALKCAVSGDPHLSSPLADEAVAVLAFRLEVGGESPWSGRVRDLAAHVDAWGDVEGRTTESAVAVLEAAADAVEVAA